MRKKLFKKSRLALEATAAIVLMASFGGASYASSYTQETIDGEVYDIYTNTMVADPSTPAYRRDVDLPSYDHADRHLKLNWTADNGRPDGGAIRATSITAKTISVDTNFLHLSGGKVDLWTGAWTSRSIVGSKLGGDSNTHLKAEKISFKTAGDSIYTESSGVVLIEGFKEFTAEAGMDKAYDTSNLTTAYGIVENGGGVTLKGEEGSTITIKSLYDAMANNCAFYDGIGVGINASAGTIILESKHNGLGATSKGSSASEGHFTINLSAENISIKGDANAAFVSSDGRISINGDGAKKGTVQLTGRLSAEGKGEILANLDGKGSFLKHGDANAISAGRLGTDPTDCNCEEGKAPTEDSFGKVTLNFNGAEQYIDGAMKAIVEGSEIKITSTGEKFTLSNSSADAEYLSRTTQNASTIIDLSGANASVTGNLIAQTGGKTQFTMAGEKSTFKGDLQVGDGSVADDAITTDTSEITAVIKNNSTWEGNVKHESGKTTVSLDASKWTGSALGGEVKLTDSTWNVTTDSEPDSLSVDSTSTVSLAKDARSLTVMTLEGSGTFLLDMKHLDNDVATYREGKGSDYLMVTSEASGEHKVVATPESDVTLAAGDKLYFATVPADSATFTVEGSTFVVNKDKLYDSMVSYKLGKETDETETRFNGFDNWFLTLDKENTKDVPNDNAFVPGVAHSAALALWRDNDTLLQRLGELHYGTMDDGAWARVTNRKMKRSGEHAMSSKWSSVQLGYDLKKVIEKQGDWYFGLGYTHSWGKPDYEAGSGKVTGNEFTLYATNLRENGHTIDIVGRVGRLDSEFTTRLGDKGEFKNWAASLGVEYGNKTFLAERFTIEPQAQLTYHYLWGDNYRTRNGIEVRQDNADSLVGRLGLVAAYEWNQTPEKAGRIYAKASVLHDFLGDVGSTLEQKISVNDKDDLGDTWYVLGIGTNLKLGKAWAAYVDLETSLNADVKTKYNLNAGVRYEF